MTQQDRRGTRLLLLAWSALSVGISAREGEFSGYGLALVVTGLALVIVVVVRRLPVTVPDRRALVVPVVVSLLAALAHPARRHMHAGSSGLLATGLLSVALAALAATSLAVPGRHQPRAWLGLAGLAAVAGAITVLVVPNPRIDVWWLLQQSSQGLLRGKDLYLQSWQHSTGLQDVYPYLPGTTLLLAPFRWLLGDVRFGLLAACLLAAVLVRRAAPRAPAALAGLLLIMPHWVLLVDQSWTEPLLVVALATAVLALAHERPGAAVLALAVALASKQHVVLLLPLFALWPSFGWRRTGQAAALAALVVLPWVLADPGAFWHDAVQANLGLGPTRRALCLPSLIERGGVTVGLWFPLLALSASYALVVRKVPRTPSGLALASALVLWTLDVTNTQSFFNHYTLPLGLLVVALATAGPTPVEQRQDELAGLLELGR